MFCSIILDILNVAANTHATLFAWNQNKTFRDIRVRHYITTWTESVVEICHYKATWASCQIRNIAVCACAGNAGYVFPRRRLKSKSLVSDPGMHHGTCVTHVPCMSGSLTRGGGENVPGISSACASAIWRIWQEAHYTEVSQLKLSVVSVQYIHNSLVNLFRDQMYRGEQHTEMINSHETTTTPKLYLLYWYTYCRDVKAARI